MYAKSFMALDGNGRLMGARTAQTAPYDRYRCHLCDSALQYHPEYQTGRPWFEHRRDALTKNGRQHCPYVNPAPKETRHVRQLQWYVPEARPLVYHADWHCSECGSDYHGERYCLACRTGEYSQERADMAASAQEVTACAC
ncbi:putative zinc ribbon protein [Enterobacter cloacae]|uniref:putative zinc ribbon protein n=1 Tax=Enterobacter TaxID=547 RepID=UPI00300C6557